VPVRGAPAAFPAAAAAAPPAAGPPAAAATPRTARPASPLLPGTLPGRAGGRRQTVWWWGRVAVGGGRVSGQGQGKRTLARGEGAEGAAGKVPPAHTHPQHGGLHAEAAARDVEGDRDGMDGQEQQRLHGQRL